jgi:hypothetical protein
LGKQQERLLSKQIEIKIKIKEKEKLPLINSEVHWPERKQARKKGAT